MLPNTNITVRCDTHSHTLLLYKKCDFQHTAIVTLTPVAAEEAYSIPHERAEH